MNYRWPNLLLTAFFLLLIITLVNSMLQEYFFTNTQVFQHGEGERIVFGLSLVEGNRSTLLNNSQTYPSDSNWSTSFFSRSERPSVQVYLDYISIADDIEIPTTVCFATIHLYKDQQIPLEVLTEAGLLNSSGKLNEFPSEYLFEFNEPLCLKRGYTYYLPHLLLGATSAEVHAKLTFLTITGQRAFEFFPFDKQNIRLNIIANRDTNSETGLVRPRLDATFSQQGWVGEFVAGEDQQFTMLQLSRPTFYQIILIFFFISMIVIILLLGRSVTGEGFFEYFGLLLALWGTHQILVPEHIGSSVVVDFVVYTIFAIVIGRILLVAFDKSLIDRSKHGIRITNIVTGNLSEEHVEIENPSIFPIDMTGWVLYDQVSHRFKFPVFVLPGINPFLNKNISTVKIWTKAMPYDISSKQLAKHVRNNLYWGRKQEIWDNDRDVAYLEDSKGEAISTYSRRKSQL